MDILRFKKVWLWLFRCICGASLLAILVSCSGKSSSSRSSEASNPATPELVAVDILLPGNKTTVAGSATLALTWTKNSEQPDNLKLLLSSNDGVDFSEVADVNNLGSHSWTTPSNTGTTYKLRLVSAANNQIIVANSPVFTIDSAPPVLGADQTVGTTSGVPIAIQLNTATDLTSVTYEVVASPSHGTVSGCGTGSSGSCTYTPSGGYVGSDVFTYRAVDSVGNASASTAQVTVTIAVGGNTILARAIVTAGGGFVQQGNANGIISIGLPKEIKLEDSGKEHIKTTLSGILGN